MKIEKIKIKRYGPDLIAHILYLIGIEPKISSGICGGLTYGYGKLDNNGYFHYMLLIDYNDEGSY